MNHKSLETIYNSLIPIYNELLFINKEWWVTNENATVTYLAIECNICTVDSHLDFLPPLGIINEKLANCFILFYIWYKSNYILLSLAPINVTYLANFMSGLLILDFTCITPYIYKLDLFPPRCH